MKPKIVNTCLEADEIERFVLTREGYDLSQELIILNHINYCPHCYKKFYEIELFHDILNTELKKPISEQVLNLVEHL